MCGRTSSFEKRTPILGLTETIQGDGAQPTKSHPWSERGRFSPLLPGSSDSHREGTKFFRNIHLIEKEAGIRSVEQATEILIRDPCHANASKYLGWSILQASGDDIDAVVAAIDHLTVSISSGNSTSFFPTEYTY